MFRQFGDKIRGLREEQGLFQREVAARLQMDGPAYSRIERGDTIPKKEVVLRLAALLKHDEKNLITLWLADQVSYLISEEDYGIQALHLAEEQVKYHRNEVPIRKSTRGRRARAGNKQ